MNRIAYEKKKYKTQVKIQKKQAKQKSKIQLLTCDTGYEQWSVEWRSVYYYPHHRNSFNNNNNKSKNLKKFLKRKLTKT